ncbi:MAG: hypothetical protein HQL33_10720 [Alphaproteobacteria bacterium]|nr:hypothetical protein [Alphaproteobacteria bacterium]
MAFKPNYGQQRVERERAKQAKKQEKLKQRQEHAVPQDDVQGETPSNAGDDQK